VRRAAQPDAGGRWPGDLAGMAWGGACRCAPAQGDARASPIGEDDVLAVSSRVGNVKNNDPSLIERIAAILT